MVKPAAVLPTNAPLRNTVYVSWPAGLSWSVDAVQDKLIWDGETAVADSPVGTVGADVSGGGVCLKATIHATGARLDL